MKVVMPMSQLPNHGIACLTKHLQALKQTGKKILANKGNCKEIY